MLNNYAYCKPIDSYVISIPVFQTPIPIKILNFSILCFTPLFLSYSCVFSNSYVLHSSVPNRPLALFILFLDSSANAVRRQVAETVSARSFGNRKGKENKGSRYMFSFLWNRHLATGIKEKESKFPPFQNTQSSFLSSVFSFLRFSFNPNSP